MSVAVPVGLVLVGLTPPFQVPDEPNHFFRAYQVSEGDFAPQRTSTSIGGTLPRSLPHVAFTIMGNVPFNPNVKQDLDVWQQVLDVPLLPHDRAETAFPNTALSGPTAYLPQAFGVLLGRTFGGSALTVFYCGRICNLLLCVALTALAIRWLPFRRWTCVLLSLLPITLFVRSSLSSDGPTLALTMLTLAICLRHVVVQTDANGSRLRWLLLCVAALMALGKPPYGAVAFLALALPTRLLGGTRRYFVTMAALGVVFVIAQGAWALALRGKTATVVEGADPQSQLTYIGEHPADAAAFLVTDFVRSSPTLTRQAVGVLGWLDASIPIGAVVSLAVVVVLVAFGEPGVPAAYRGIRWLAALIFCMGALTLHAMNFVWWTPPGATRVAGIQGRHLLPLVPFLLLSFNAPSRIAERLSRLHPLFVIAFIVVSVVSTVLTVIRRYYIDV